jgi:hypothetical protein
MTKGKIAITYWEGMHPSRRYQAVLEDSNLVAYGPTFREAIINLLDLARELGPCP